MRVLLLGPYPVDPRAPAGKPPLPGGVDAVVLALARGLARCPGVDVQVATAAPGLDRMVEVASAGYRVACLPRPRGGRLTGQRAVVRALRDHIAAARPDIVHAHIAGIYARAALDSGRPAVVTLHGIIWREMEQAWPTAPWPVRLRWLSDALFERRVLRRAADIISISPYVLAEAQPRTRARFHAIENPVDDRFFGVPPLAGQGERLLCVARVIPRKGIAMLISAFALVAAARPAATLTLAGELDTDPAYAAQCRALAVELGIAGRVEFAGALPPEEIQARYAAADVVVLASEQETAPVTIAEAMAAGRPVVTADVGGCASMVTDGATGCVAPPRDPAAFAAALIPLLADPARRRRMGEASRAAALARFRLDAVVAATLKTYAQVIARAEGGRA